MYQRKYYKDDTAMKIPDNYGGLAIDADGYIAEDAAQEPPTAEAVATPFFAVQEPAATDRECYAPKRTEARFGGTVLQSLEGLCRRIGLHAPTFDKEDILLIAVALFLFFSKDGDKECALLLVALLFFS